jgi:NADH-quinone oxidoreductase subunit H
LLTLTKIIESFLSIIIIVLASAYTSLLERQTVAILQQRFGPSLTGGFAAILQPIADGFKLLTKEIIIPSKGKIFLYLLAPIYTFTITLSP